MSNDIEIIGGWSSWDKPPEQVDLDFKLFERLGLCGCGNPDSVLILIHEILKYIQWQTDSVVTEYSGPIWDERLRIADEKLKKIIDENHNGVKYLLYYLLADRRITEHGSSVPGWIIDYDFCKDLNDWRIDWET